MHLFGTLSVYLIGACLSLLPWINNPHKGSIAEAETEAEAEAEAEFLYIYIYIYIYK